MEQFNSGELRIIFRVHFHKQLTGRTIVGRHAWQQEEQKGDISIALIILEQFFISVLFRDILDDLIDPMLKENVRIQAWQRLSTRQGHCQGFWASNLLLGVHSCWC